MNKYLFNMIRMLKVAIFINFILGSSTSASELTKEREIINKVVNAYGGERLSSLPYLTLIDYNKGPWPGESESPGIPEIWRINEELTIDFEKKRKSLLSYRVPRTTIDLEKWVADDNGSIVYDILHRRYSNDDWATYNRLGGSIERSSDTMHAKWLTSKLDEASYLGTEYYRGQKHDKLSVKLSSKGEYIYFVNETSGLISKFIRKHPQAELVYVLSNHRVSDGITYSADMNFFVNGELRLTSIKRGINLKPDLADAFSGFEGFEYWGKTIESEGMAAKKLMADIYQVGEGRSLTVFIEQQDYLIALGNASALNENLSKLRDVTATEKPLSYFIVTHHHRGSIRGLNNAVVLGATLVMSEAHRTVITDSLLPEYSNNAPIITVAKRQKATLGDLVIYDIPTAHSRHYLLAYSAKNKAVIAEEHYETSLKTNKPRVHRDMVAFSNALDSLDIAVDELIDIRSRRRFKFKELKNWTSEFVEKSCPAEFAICAEG